MEALRQVVGAFDYHWIQIATNWTAGSPLRISTVYLAADLLIFLYPLVLLYMWEMPSRERGDRQGPKKAVIMAVMSLVLALAIRAFIAFIFFRARPFVSHPDLLAMHLTAPDSSFPSGHTTVAFSIATSILLSGYKKRGLVLLVVALCIGLARIFSGVHYPSDIFVGMVIAIWSAWYLNGEASSLRRYLPNR